MIYNKANLKEDIKTRQQYLDGTVGHREYYAQFLDEQTERELLSVISLKEIKASTDEHMNDIKLRRWDSISGSVFGRHGQIVAAPTIRPSLYRKLKEVGEQVSPATMVCIYKEQARQLKEQR